MAQTLQQFAGGLNANVSCQQPGFQFFENFLIDLTTAKQIGKVIGQPGLRFVKFLPQAAEETLTFGGFDYGCVTAPLVILMIVPSVATKVTAAVCISTVAARLVAGLSNEP